MDTVKIHYKNGTISEIPLSNLERTIDLLQDAIKKIDYGDIPQPTVSAPAQPDMTWTKKKLLKFAKDHAIAVSETDTKAVILKALT